MAEQKLRQSRRFTVTIVKSSKPIPHTSMFNLSLGQPMSHLNRFILVDIQVCGRNCWNSGQSSDTLTTWHFHPLYPEEAPDISVVYSKGLDEQRQKHLISSLQDKALELVSCLVLVTLYEEAAEKLSSMNHPDGSCPLCLYPIVDENVGNN